MEEELIEALGALRDVIGEDPRIKALEEADEALGRDPEAALLSQRKKAAAERFYSARRDLNEDPEELMRLRLAYVDAIRKLRANKSVIAYEKAYAAVSELYEKIGGELFRPFAEDLGKEP